MLVRAMQLAGLSVLTLFGGVAKAHQKSQDLAESSYVESRGKPPVSTYSAKQIHEVRRLQEMAQSYEQQLYPAARHESWDINVAPEGLYIRNDPPIPDLKEAKNEGNGPILFVFGLFVFLSIVSLVISMKEKSALERTLDRAKKGEKGLKNFKDWKEYLKTPRDSRYTERAYEYWELAQSSAANNDHEEAYVNLDVAAYNGHQFAADTLVDIWVMLVTKDEKNELYESYEFLTKGLSERQMKKVLEFYRAMLSQIIERRSKFKPVLLRGGGVRSSEDE